jgi:uncharacterized membrane protein YgcG
VTETTIENKSVWVVDNSKKLKACPKDQCHCPCACKKGGGSGQKDKKSGKKSGSGGKKSGSGGKSKGKGKGCPPGLAKSGCQPPGQAKKGK